MAREGAEKLIILLIFVAIAANINHIDDTDETYGYWEPLHYVTYQLGMQTWEYCPEYAIRTYAFILPFLPITSLWNYLRMDKITLFYAIKNILGLFFAISCRSFLRSIRKIFGSHIEGLTFLLLLTSPGIFFSSTSYLPSAVCSSLIMFSFACWLQDNFKSSIFFGCVAVLWSGWPFVGVIFLPIGLEMLYSTYSKHIMKPFMTRINAVLQFIISGLFLVFVTGFGALAIDSYMYGKLTFPPLNIALYNAFGGRGDELYGVEPPSYYVLNLILMLGPVSFVLCLLGPLLILSEYFLKFSSNSIIKTKMLVFISPAILWLAILFSRPHKEERFIYPIYPLLITISATSLTLLLDIYDLIIHFLFTSKVASGSSSSTVAAAAAPSPSLSSLGKFLSNKFKIFLLFLLLLIAFLFGLSRVIASYRNYGGYIQLWKKTHHHLLEDFQSLKIDTINMTDHRLICMGGDWFTFPSHFFVPLGAKVGYVEDNFHGLLPQHFLAPYGSSIPSILPVNDLNQEEKSRYNSLVLCDYLVMTTPTCLLDSTHEETLSSTCYQSLSPLQKRLVNRDYDDDEFLLKFCEKIIDPVASISSIGRAYTIPGYSSKTNKYMEYCLYKKVLKFNRSK